MKKVELKIEGDREKNMQARQQSSIVIPTRQQTSLLIHQADISISTDVHTLKNSRTHFLLTPSIGLGEKNLRL